MPGKTSKQTKKFAKSKLADIIKQRKQHKKENKLKERIKNKQNKRKRSDDDSIEEEDIDLGQKKLKTEEIEDDMNVDDFLEKGFFEAMEQADSEEEGLDDSDEDIESSKSSKKSKSHHDAQDDEDEMEQHKRDLEELRKDPKQAAFLEYLEKEAPNLLDVDASEDESGEADSVEEDDEESAKLILTLPILELWKNSLLKDKSLPAFKRLVQSFRVACHMNDNVDETGNPEESSQLDKRFQYQITEPEVFNEVIIFVLKNFGKAVRLLVGKEKEVVEDEKDSNSNSVKRPGFIPSRFPRWPKIKDAVKSFFSNLSYFISTLSDPKMLNFVLQNLEPSIMYLTGLPMLQKKFLKILLGLWSSSAESVRILAFFCLRKMALELPYPFIDQVLKGIYLTYVRNCKFVNRTTVPLITFLCNCVVEIYGLDFVSSYQHAFVYIRELASHLRNSFSSKKKEVRKNIYNFQYLNSINAWVRILVAYPGQEQLALLYYPLVQLIQGSIAYQPTNRYFPLRLHFVKMLNQLAVASHSYLNAASYLLEVLASPDMVKRPRPSMEKSLDIRISLKVSKAAMGSKIYQDVIFDETLDLLAEYLATYSRSIAFPELVFPISNALTKFRKATRNPLFAKRVKTLQEKILATVRIIQAKRNQVSFSPQEIAKLSNFLSDEPTPLTKYYDEIAAVQKPEIALQSEEEDSDDESEDDADVTSDAGSLLDSDEDERNADDGNADEVGSDDDVVQDIDEDMMDDDE